MGGKALKTTFTRRYQKSEFDSLAKILLPKIQDAFRTKANLIKSYNNKESFGDMDILLMSINKDKDNQQRLGKIKEIIQENFHPNEIKHNGSCWSFDYQELQIDLIITSYSNWEIANIFYSYNDLGNLMGKMFHKFNLKYGFDGLKYIHRKNDQRLSTISISKNPRKIFDFLCLDYDRFLQGFDEIEDIFEYITSSRFFNPESFKFENLNSINKRRNKRRENYNKFIEYCKNFTSGFEYNKNKHSYLPIIDAFFPEANLLKNIQKAEEIYNENLLIKTAYNGNIIMNMIPELYGKKLGIAMKSFEEKIEIENDTKFKEYLKNKIESNKSSEILQEFLNYYNKK